MIRFNVNNKFNFLIFFSELTRTIFGGDRIKRLSSKVKFILDKEFLKKNKKICIIDFGCGSMEIAKEIQNKKYIKKIIGLDVYKNNFKNKKLTYKQYKKLSNLATFKADAILIIDVLHHMGTDDAYKTLKELSKISNILIIKDHFEYGFFSRHFLRFVDFYANYAYGVTIPSKYFSVNSWEKTVKKSGLREVYAERGFQQHDGLFSIILNKKYHFFSLLKKK
jgi:hypothetical protein